MEFAVLILTVVAFSVVSANIKDGLYVTNGTDILYIENPESTSSEVKSIYTQSGTIVGIAYDKASGVMFWSTIEVTRGIYRGMFNADGEIINETKIIDQDVLEVNCLTYDWISKHLYWTDGRKRTVEVSEADGNNRRILFMTGLQRPRGIYADPVNGYLFWNDQERKVIERSELDGSNRTAIVSQGVGLPNQIIVNNNKLFWVDSDSKTLESSNLNGDERQTRSVNGQQVANNQHIFGLAIDGGKAYITNWKNGRILVADIERKTVVKGTEGIGKENIFSAVFVRAIHQPNVMNPCRDSGCSALCLPNKSTLKFRCSCPSYGGLTLGSDKKSCQSPASVLLYAVASSGYVCFRDASVAFSEAETHVVGRSLRPVAVAYDPVLKRVYWSDVRDKTVRAADIAGTNHEIILGIQQGIGLVEGMVVDVKRRQLYYTNIGSVLLDGTPYSWHRVETINLGDTQIKVKTLVTTADKPRGLALDSTNGHLYYTDWGNRASVVRVDLDGSNPTLIRTGLDNPNGIALVNNKLYFVDSHYKTRQPNRGHYPVTPRNGSLYSMNLDGSGFEDVLVGANTKFQTPFGLTASTDGDLYVSDWGAQSLTLLRKSQPPFIEIQTDIPEMMSLYFSPYSDTAGASNCRSCGDLCLSKNANETQCACNSYAGKPISGDRLSCSVPTNFILVADMNAIKIVSLDDQDSNPYIAVQGSPYFANFVALTYDAVNKKVYYSDVNGRAIKALNLTSMETSTVYRVNEVIDGLIFHNGALYWSDYLNGKISILRLNPSPQGELRHRTFIDKLKRPRGIKIQKDYIYWTEWGETPCLARRSLRGSSGKQILQTENLVWPNGIYIDQAKDRLYMVDGNTKAIFNCSLDGKCESLAGVRDALQHAYDIWFQNDVFYYSDWKSGAIKAFHPEKPGTSWTVVGDLMRPTQIHIQRSSSVTSKCKQGSCAGGDCVPFIVNQGCYCQGKGLSYDERKCTESADTCTYNGSSFLAGKEFQPKPCVNCQCIGRVPFPTDPVYNNSLCRRVECPEPNCPPNQRQFASSTSCCMTCSNCNGIRITNCPEDVRRTLRDDLGYLVYDYTPSIEDCRGQFRETNFRKEPEGSVYRFGRTRVQVTATAKKDSGLDIATCSYEVVVEDKTPPVIRCPKNIRQYVIDDSPVEVYWNSPTAYDNVGLAGAPKPSRAWGSLFGVGTHKVTYTATDEAGMSSMCSFNVTIEKIGGARTSCKIPRISNADMTCVPLHDGVQLRCRFECNADYRKGSVIEALICTGGEWNPQITEALLHESCIKEKLQSMVGRLTLTIPNACDKDLDRKYVEEFLYISIKKNYLVDSRSELTVKSRECKPGSKNLTVTADLKIEGREASANASKAEIDDKLKELRKHLETGFLNVVLLDKSGVHTATDLTIQVQQASLTCLPGEIPRNDSETLKCDVCPTGKYQLEGSCESCPSDTYNDIEAQTECKPCPNGAKSEKGSYTLDQCKGQITSTVLLFNNQLFYIIVAGASLLLIVVVVIIIVVACKRRRKPIVHLRNSLIHPNKTFDHDFGNDETYDKIAEPSLNENDCNGQSPTTARMNDYEILAGTGAAGAAGGTDESYDRIVATAEGQGAENTSNGESSKEGTPSAGSEGSTCPYLVPVA